MRRCVIYVRISQDRDGDSLGVNRQEEECRKLADSLCWSVDRVYVDNDVSASSGRVRPMFEAMKKAMADGDVEAVIAWHPDRLYRLPRELETLIDIAERERVAFATCRAGEIDLSTASGRFVARLLGAAARHEAELKGERQALKSAELARAGKPRGGPRPFGWSNDRLSLHPTEAPVLKELIERAIAGESLFGMCKDLQDRGIPTAAGGARWSVAPLRRILVNPRVAGHSVHRGQIVGKGQWEPIVDDAKWRRAVAALEYGRPAGARTRIALFSRALIFCDVCGFPLSTFRQTAPKPKGTGEGRRSYGCRDLSRPGSPGFGQSCGRISIAAEKIEEDVVERVIARVVKHGELFRNAQRTGSVDDATASAEREEIEQLRREAVDDLAEGLLRRADWLRLMSRLEAREAKIPAPEQRIALPAGEVPIDSARSMVRWWDDASLSKRIALVESQVAKITVSPHRGARHLYDTGRVRVSWRNE